MKISELLLDLGITDKWQALEIGVIAIVILYQFFHTNLLYRKIMSLKNTFRNQLYLRKGFIERNKIGKVEAGESDDIYFEDNIDLDEESFSKVSDDNVIPLALLETNGKNQLIKNIKNGINNYLINNYGASVNFSIIKDIIDREINVKDNEINQSISLPLYLGLSATMIGIIFGLFSMPSLENEEGFTSAINALIGGVKIAMIGSLTGLICTTFLSSFAYKKAIRKLEKEKNDQLTYLQAKLLPELLRTEETGVSGLKASLDRFSRIATQISDGVIKSVDKTEKNLELQNNIIDKVNELDVQKVSNYNLELFKRIENNMEALKDFSSYINQLKQISSQLSDFSNRTSNIDKIINNIDSNLEQSKQISQFLSSHLDEIKNSGDYALQAVGIAEKHFEQSIEDLKLRTDKTIKYLYKTSGEHEVKLEKIYSDINENLNKISSEYVQQLKDVFDDSTLNFKRLEKLDHLDQINNTVSKMEDNNLFLDKLSSIENKLESQDSNQSVIKKLVAIEDEIKKSNKAMNNIRKKTDEPKKTYPGTVKSSESIKKNESISLIKAFKEVFKK